MIMKAKKIIKWPLIIILAGLVLYSFMDDEEESTESKQTVKVTSDLHVSDFKLDKDISKAFKTLRAKGWVPGDGDMGECGSGYSDFLAGYGYEKTNGSFENYDVPFIIISSDENGNLAHFKVIINTKIDSNEIENAFAELDKQEQALFDKIDPDEKPNTNDVHTMFESIRKTQENITPEIEAEFDEIKEKRKKLVEESKQRTDEARKAILKDMEKKFLLQYGYLYFADENEKNQTSAITLGYKNSNGDICKMDVAPKSSFETVLTLDYVSARFRNEELLAYKLMWGY